VTPRVGALIALIALVALGGAFGAAARYLAFETWPVAPETFPTTTLCINVIGAVLLGVVIVRLHHVWWARPLLGVGVLSGFTTMSTLAVEVAALIRADEWTVAAAYVGASAMLGIAAAWTGARIGRA